MKLLSRSLLAALCAGALSTTADAVVLVLDDTNGYTATIAPGVTISQPAYTTAPSGGVLLTGATAAIGVAGIADFTTGTFDQIGGNAVIGGIGGTVGSAPGSPAAFVNNALAFTIRDEGTGDLYDAVITFFRAADGNGANAGGVGTPPVPDSNAGLVVDVNLVPEPSSALLTSFALIGLGLRRRR
ncbi:MAG: PEP-CTERM sorting domain-containing protein [Bacteroidota bacterium]